MIITKTYCNFTTHVLYSELWEKWKLFKSWINMTVGANTENKTLHNATFQVKMKKNGLW